MPCFPLEGVVRSHGGRLGTRQVASQNETVAVSGHPLQCVQIDQWMRIRPLAPVQIGGLEGK